MFSIITGPITTKIFTVRLAILATAALVASGCDKVPLLAPNASTITMSTNSSIVQANGTAEIRATVLEASGTPVQNGTTVTFSTNLGALSPIDARTTNGVAITQFVANGQSGIAEIHANSGSAKSTDSTAATGPIIRLTVGAAAVGRLALTATPSTVPSSGGTSTVVANVGDASGNPLGGVSVTFSTTAGSLSSAFATSDVNGRAQTTLTTNVDATVTATAGGAAGTTATAALTGTVVIKANSGPTVATFTPSPASPLVGQLVSVNVSATAAAGGSAVQRILVDFGDGGSATINGSSGGATHSYSRAGSFAIRATAFDAIGDSGSNVATLSVTASTKPTVTISAATASPTTNTVTTFNFTANTTQTGASMESVTIDFDDGSIVPLGAVTGSGTAQHTYATTATGSRTVKITATDSNGATASASTVIVVGGTGTALTVTLTPTLSAGLVVSFMATPIDGSNYFWVFGDGNSRVTTINTTTYPYTTTGSKTATVTVTKAGQAGTGSATFTPIP
jgi:Bacterial Ig-like domain (group 1)/PKD domain